MKEQLGSRLGLAHVRDVLQQVGDRTISVEQACVSWRMAKTRLYELRSAYLKARAAGMIETWRPGVSGGNHAVPWDAPVVTFLREAIRFLIVSNSATEMVVLP